MSTSFYWRVIPSAHLSAKLGSLYLDLDHQKTVVHTPVGDEARLPTGQRVTVVLVTTTTQITVVGGDASNVKSTDLTDPAFHIGKRCAAGLYCRDCNVSLRADGGRYLHYKASAPLPACPKCGAGADSNPIAGPVVYASSFTWAQKPEDVRKACMARAHEPIAVDEYGRLYTGTELLTELDSIEIHIHEQIGTHFS